MGTRKTKEPLRMAVVGLGHFAQVAVLPGIQQLSSVELTALVSGSTTKLDELGDKYGVSERRSYAELDQLLASGAVDAVYIVTPNDLHAPLAIRAAEHGVHVLCEKPLAPTVAECADVIRACERSGVKLMVGYRLHFEAGNLHAIELVQSGQIGEPRVFNSTFTMQVREDNIRTEPRPGAGPLFDIGVYCINAARYLLREEPVEVSATIVRRPDDPRFAHVEEAVAATLRFPSGVLASFVVSFGAASRASYEVVGTTGAVQVENAYEYAEAMTVRHLVDGEKPKQRRFGRRDQIAAEIEHFARCVRRGEDPEPSGWEGLADVRVIAAIHQAASLGQQVALPAFDRDQRPGREQEIEVPPHGEPRTVEVESAST
jgi:predicted dehydrogenase